MCSGLVAIFSWRDFNFQRWFFIPGSIPCTLRRNVEEIGSAGVRSTFPVEVGRERAVAVAVLGSPGVDVELGGKLAGGVAELRLSTEHPEGDKSGGSGLLAEGDVEPSLLGMISGSLQTFLL